VNKLERKEKIFGAIIMTSVMLVLAFSATSFPIHTANQSERIKQSVQSPIDQLSEMIHSKFPNIQANIFNNENFFAQSYFQTTSSLMRALNSSKPSAPIMYEDSNTRPA